MKHDLLTLFYDLVDPLRRRERRGRLSVTDPPGVSSAFRELTQCTRRPSAPRTPLEPLSRRRPSPYTTKTRARLTLVPRVRSGAGRTCISVRVYGDPHTPKTVDNPTKVRGGRESLGAVPATLYPNTGPSVDVESGVADRDGVRGEGLRTELRVPVPTRRGRTFT